MTASQSPLPPASVVPRPSSCPVPKDLGEAPPLTAVAAFSLFRLPFPFCSICDVAGPGWPANQTAGAKVGSIRSAGLRRI